MTERKRIYEQYWAAHRTNARRTAENGNTPNEIFESIEAVLGEGKRLLGVGCGNGALIGLADDRFEQAKR